MEIVNNGMKNWEISNMSDLYQATLVATLTRQQYKTFLTTNDDCVIIILYSVSASSQREADGVRELVTQSTILDVIVLTN